MPPNFDQATPIFNSLIRNFEFVFKGKNDFDNSINNMIEYESYYEYSIITRGKDHQGCFINNSSISKITNSPSSST